MVKSPKGSKQVRRKMFSLRLGQLSFLKPSLPMGQAFRLLLSSISGHQVAPESGKRNRA